MSKRSATTLKRYGLTQEDFDVLFNSQDGRCMICGVKEEDLQPTPNMVPWLSDIKLHIDHDHTLGVKAIRGLLCKDCNFTVEATILGCPVIHPGHRGVSRPSRDHEFWDYLFTAYTRGKFFMPEREPWITIKQKLDDMLAGKNV